MAQALCACDQGAKLRRGPRMPAQFFTVGHSNRSLDEFTALLLGPGIRLVADIRRIPMSRAYPHFNGDALLQALSAIDISYEHMSALGGRRGTTSDVAEQVNHFWTNQS